MPPTPRQLRYFLAILEHQGYRRAAKALGVSQSALSQQIQKLEQSCGNPLLDRSQRPPKPTPLGQSFSEAAQRVLTGMADLERLSEWHSTESTAVLRLGLLPTIAPFLLATWLPAIQAQFPRLSIQVWEFPRQELIAALDSGNLDGMILALPLPAGNYVSQVFRYDSFSLLCSHDSPLAQLEEAGLETLNPEDLHLLQEGHCLRNQVLSLFPQAPKPHEVLSAPDSLHSLAALVGANGGWTLVPNMALSWLDLDRLRVQAIPLREPAPGRSLALVWPERGSDRFPWQEIARSLDEETDRQGAKIGNSPESCKKS
ncbi:MAG: LysR family transcriptional regulator [Planctomycetota bacterium]|nr:MAG: LysR family transcriptional regulator [Planctomycetota bacterium]